MYYIDAHIYMCTGRKEALARCKFPRKSSRPSSPENWSRRENDCDIYVQLRTILASICAYALFTSWKKTKQKRSVLQSCIKVYPDEWLWLSRGNDHSICYPMNWIHTNRTRVITPNELFFFSRRAQRFSWFSTHVVPVYTVVVLCSCARAVCLPFSDSSWAHLERTAGAAAVTVLSDTWFIIRYKIITSGKISDCCLYTFVHG